MLKKKKKSKANKRIYFENERALRELANMKHRDLQRACIVRGLSSQDVVNFDHHKLVQWFISNFENAQDESLLLAHDLWVEGQLELKGYKQGHHLMSPALRFSYVGDIEKMDKPKIIKPNVIPKVEDKEKKEKSTVNEETGIREGTMKHMTYELTENNIPITEIIKKVRDKYPNAKEKSIKIWHKRAKQ